MAVTSWSKQVFDEMEIVVKTYGINTFKHFMAYKGALMVNDDELYNSFARCAHLGAIPLVHAENGDVVARMQEAVLARGVVGPEGHAFSRPPEVEGEATNRAIMIADMTGAPLYVVHTSCRQSHEAIARARAAGKRVYGEPLIQHLLLDASEYETRDWDHAARRVMSPPFRDRSHQDSLWAGLQSGSLSVVATDHCAFTTEQKRIGLEDFRKIPNGTGGLEDRMPLLWTAGVNTGRLTKEEFVAVTSSNIARILNIYPRKGAVAVGSDADIVVWDPHSRTRPSPPSASSAASTITCSRVFLRRRAGRHHVARQDRLEDGELARRTRRRPLCRTAGVLAGPCRQLDLEATNGAASGEAVRRDSLNGSSMLRFPVPLECIPACANLPDVRRQYLWQCKMRAAGTDRGGGQRTGQRGTKL